MQIEPTQIRIKKIRPLPPELQLAPTLARRIFQIREFRNLTVRDLAKAARFTPQRIEDIETGMETWFSATDRQMLAKALSVEPNIIQEVEQRPSTLSTGDFTLLMQDISEAILKGSRDLPCPQCAYPLKCRIQEGLDLEGLPIQFAKAFCTKCPFVLK